MPSAIQERNSFVGGNDMARPRSTNLAYSGSLEEFTYSDLTPAIGRQYENLQIRDLLKRDDQVIRDLAVTSK